MARILIIDDEEPIRFSLRGILEDEGYEVLEAATAEEGLEVADAERPDLVFLDIWLPGMDGLTAQARLKGNHPDLPVVMISGHGTIETAVSAIQQGAYDFIEKPLSLEKVVIVAARALEAGSLRRENQVLRTVLPEQDELIGQSPVMLKFQELLARVAPHGRVGTAHRGKRHGQGTRRPRPARREPARRCAHDCGELRRHSRGAHRKRVVRA